jgi:hypothetical protein
MAVKRSVLWVLLFACLLCLQACGWLFSKERATANVTQGKNACTEVHFPTCWTAQEGQCAELHQVLLYSGPGSTPDDTYDLRQPPGQSSQVLVGFHYFPEIIGGSVPHRAESLDHYLVTLGQPGSVRKVSELEWRHGAPLAGFAAPADAENRILRKYKDDQPFPYLDKSFAKSGPQWPRIGLDADRISANGEYLAINSWDGKEAGCAGFMQPCDDFGGGHYWEDLYEIRTARRLVAVTGRFWMINHSTFFNITQWVGNRYFIRPLQQNLQTVLICDMDAAKASLAKNDRK